MPALPRSARSGRTPGGGIVARTPLRVRLVAIVTVLVVAALAASGLAAGATLRGYLTSRVDDQLRAAAQGVVDRGLSLSATRALPPLRAQANDSAQAADGNQDSDAATNASSTASSSTSSSTSSTASSDATESEGPSAGAGTSGRASVPGRTSVSGRASVPGRTDPDDVRPLPSAYVIEVLDASGRLIYGPMSNLVDGLQRLPVLPALTVAETAARQQQPFTVPAATGTVDWRALAVPVTLADGSAATILVAQSLADIGSTLGRLGQLLSVIGVVTVVVLAGVGYVVVRASLRPLVEVERTAAAIAAGDLSQRVPTAHPRTEVGRLSAALNTMLGQIESAFAAQQASEAEARSSEERMRRFVADASHELRTPLTSIRGFAELYRQGAAADPEDLTRLMRRIEDEAARMGVLVDDLLLLARLDEQRPLERVPVDLLTLASDAVHDARAIDPARRIDLVVGNSDPPPIVIGDEMRLRQVLGNLMSNALRHTPAGTPVTLRLHTEAAPQTSGRPGTAVVEVVDSGPGLTEQQAARVFQRFYRADESRHRHPDGAPGTARSGGSGLGLAIVAALVAGHGGRVAVDATPGAGATFRVTLPLAADSSAGTSADSGRR